MNFKITDLPLLNASLNLFATICILLAFIYVKKKKIHLHKLFMGFALTASVLFIVSYLVYHFNIPVEKKFPKENPLRPVYLTVLISHIVLAIPMAPVVFTALYFALTKRISNHKKIVKLALPVWLYVSVTGVLIYIFLNHLS
ncbi:MAG: DUF420 domain-containing protein [Leptospiraceae bacterium]|nr:DUF420 domain-containing protein [Leptospiraceae bacterium]MCK6379727.1 DUF420 domain-containing protein [Leptospiraceae bacterium]